MSELNLWLFHAHSRNVFQEQGFVLTAYMQNVEEQVLLYRSVLVPSSGQTRRFSFLTSAIHVLNSGNPVLNLL